MFEVKRVAEPEDVPSSGKCGCPSELVRLRFPEDGKITLLTMYYELLPTPQLPGVSESPGRLP